MLIETYEKKYFLVKMLEFRWSDRAFIWANCHDRLDSLQTQPHCGNILIIMNWMYLKIRLSVNPRELTQRSSL